MSKLSKTITKYVGNVVTEPTIKEIAYKIYWLEEPHCEKAVSILQVDRKIGWKCEHRIT